MIQSTLKTILKKHNKIKNSNHNNEYNMINEKNRSMQVRLGCSLLIPAGALVRLGRCSLSKQLVPLVENFSYTYQLFQRINDGMATVMPVVLLHLITEELNNMNGNRASNDGNSRNACCEMPCFVDQLEEYNGCSIVDRD